MEDLKKLMKGRSASRRYVKKTITETAKILAATDQDVDKLKTNKDILCQESESLKKRDQEILNLIDEEKFEDEILECKEFSGEIQYCLTQIESKLKVLVIEPEVEREPRRESFGSARKVKTMKLPTLTLQKFSGNPTEWPSFWETFKAAIHSDEEMEDVMKFSYLKSYLVGPAAHAVAGLKVTNSTYKEALDVLHKRFGDVSVIIGNHMDALLHCPAVQNMNDVKKLRELYDKLEVNVRSLGALGLHSGGYQQVMSPEILKKLPSELQVMITRRLKGSCDLQYLLEIFHEELLVREKCVLSQVSAEKSKPANAPQEAARNRFPYRNQQGTAATLYTGIQTNDRKFAVKCAYCDGDHKSHLCTTVTDHVVRRKILTQKNRCFICLRANHLARNCRSNMTCLKCNRRHHSTICECYSKPMTTKNGNESDQKESSFEAKEPESASTTNMHVSARNSVLLQTARAEVKAPGKPRGRNFRFVFDSGSQKSYVTVDVKNALSLPIVGKDKLLIKTFGDESPKVRDCEIVQFSVGCKNGEEIVMQAYVVPVICTPISNQVISRAVKHYEHLRGLDLADFVEEDELNIDRSVDILIGADFYWRFVTGRIVQGKKAGPVAMETKLGWVLSGPTDMVSSDSDLHAMRIDTVVIDKENFAIANEVKKFWENEAIGIKGNEDQFMHEKFVDEIEFVDNRYEVKLPFKDGHPILPDNYSLAKRRLFSLVNRLQQNKEIAEQYDEIIKDQLEKGIVERVDESAEIELGKVSYLPHREVLRPDKETTKLRIVFDASAKNNGPSLNDCLDSGPSLLPLLYDILLRFRAKNVVLIGDIEKAFLNISVAPQHRDTMRFLWVDDVQSKDPKVVVYRIARVCFGAVCSPFCLNAVVQHHLAKFEDDREFVESVKNSLYCDDFVGGADSQEGAITLYKKLKERFRQGGFNMRKWHSNSEEVLAKIEQFENEVSPQKEARPSEEKLSDTPLSKNDSEKPDESKVLGMNWNSKSDELAYDFNAMLGSSEKEQITKRDVLATTAKIFDPLGLISPVIVPLKLLFQRLCKQTNDWNSLIDESILSDYKSIVNDMKHVGRIVVDRNYFGRDIAVSDVDFIELHGFCDASKASYGACIYVVCHLKSGQITSSLVSSKTRIAPIGGETIPRLELLAALILSRLMKSVREALGPALEIKNCYAWSDSKIVIWWLCSESKVLKSFVQNRVNEIRKLVPPPLWRYCPTKLNPADILSRGMKASKLVNNEFWWKGPEFLRKPVEFWPEKERFEHCKQANNEFIEFEEVEGNPVNVNVHLVHEERCNISNVISIERFSDVNKLYRTTAYVLRFARNLKARIDNTETALTADLETSEIENAKIKWFRAVQADIRRDKGFENLKANLNLFEDENKVLRCRGRLGNAPLDFESRYPVILPRDGHFTDLIIDQCHKTVKHNGVKDTLTELRSNFWIVKGRQKIKRFVTRCTVCKRVQGKSYDAPPQPPLPEFRVDVEYAFYKIGVDFAGPLYVKNIYGDDGSMYKVYILLITCASTRAIHLELVPNLEADSLIRGLKRFQARRGIPRFVISDNGSTFKDAKVRAFLIENGIAWKFIIERASWFGGFYERLVQAVKKCLKKVLRNAKLDYEELSTELIEIEGVLNCRPLTYVYDELGHVLTPSHLICGRRVLDKPDKEDECEIDVIESRKSLSKRSRYLEKLLDHFRRRFRHEYLTSLREFHVGKKLLTNRVIKVGDIVTIHEEKRPRQLWNLGRVTKLLTGKDGNVRSAVVRVYRKGRAADFRRPIKKLYPVEVADAEENAEDRRTIVEREDEEPQIRTVLDEHVGEMIH